VISLGAGLVSVGFIPPFEFGLTFEYRGAVGHLLNPGFVILSKEWGVSVDVRTLFPPVGARLN